MTEKAFNPGATDFTPGNATCPQCSEVYFKDHAWKRLCLDCYLGQQGKRRTAPAEVHTVVVTEPIEPGMLRRLIQLCHPDKHAGSEAATLATQYLLKLRGAA